MKTTFILFRSNPYRPLFGGGLGFREPPNASSLSHMSRKERKRWNLWEFSDWSLADQLRRAMNKKNHSDLVEVAKAPASLRSQPKHAKKKSLPKGLEALA